MTTFKKLAVSFILSTVLAVPSAVGQVGPPPCLPGEMNSPPCTGAPAYDYPAVDLDAVEAALWSLVLF